MIDRNNCEAILSAVYRGAENDPYMQAILQEIDRLNRRLEAQTVFLGHVPPVFVTPPFEDAVESVAFELWTASLQETLRTDENATLVIDITQPPWPEAAVSNTLH
ncbi:MAG: hypothetical protein AB7R90_15285 [Reyranellaceae bacterium]